MVMEVSTSQLPPQHIYTIMDVLTPQVLPITHLHCHGCVNITTPPLQHIYTIMDVLTPHVIPTTHLHCHGCVDTTSST